MICPSSPGYRGAAAAVTRPSPSDTPTTRPWSCRTSTTSTASPSGVLLRPVPGGASGRGSWRRYGDLDRAQRGVGHRLLGPALRQHRARPYPRAAAATVVNPGPAAGLRALLPTTSFGRASWPSATSCRPRAPHLPVTTNFMAHQLSESSTYWTWAREVDIVTNDHYLIAAARATPTSGLAMAADLTRSVAGGRPWLLMEHSTSARQLAAPQHRQGPGRDGPQLASATSPAAPRARCSSSGAPRAAAPRSSTPRCSRTAAPRPGSSARSSSSAPPWAAWRPIAAPASRPMSPSCGTGSPSGRRTSSGAPVSTSTTASAPTPSTEAVARRHHRRLRPPRGRPLGVRLS